MARSSVKETKKGKLKVENKRKHEVRLTDRLSIGPLKDILIESEDWNKITSKNRHIREAVNKKFLKVTWEK